MGSAARKDTVELPADAFDRLLAVLERQAEQNERHTRALEQLAQTEKRKLAQEEDNARRSLARAGATTAEAEARVAARLKKLGG